MKRLFVLGGIFAALLVASVDLYAQGGMPGGPGGPGGGRRGGGEGGMGGGRRGGEMRGGQEERPRVAQTLTPEQWEKVRTELKEKYPEEMAEIEKLQSTNRRAAMEKTRELAKKAGISLGEESGRPDFAARFEQINAQLKEKYPEEMAEIEKLRETDPRAAFQKTGELMQKAGIEMPRPGGQNNEVMQKINEKIQSDYADELKEIEKLRESDRREAGRKYMELQQKVAKELGVEVPQMRGRGGMGPGGPGMGGEADAAAPAPENRGNRERAVSAAARQAELEKELETAYPEEYAKLVELRKTNSAAARREFRVLARKLQDSKK